MSDHNVVIVCPTCRTTGEGPSRKVIVRRDTRPSRKLDLGRYLAAIDWTALDSAVTCDDKLKLLVDTIVVGMDYIMPAKQFRVHYNDPPWMTPEFKSLVVLRQRAFHSGNTERYRHYRHVVNRKRKALRGKYFASKVNHLKDTRPSQWWSAVKRIAGMVPTSGSVSLRSTLQVEGYDRLSDREVANAINSAFLEPMNVFVSLESIPPFEEESEVLIVSEAAVSSALKKLNPLKASGPDSIPNWLLRE